MTSRADNKHTALLTQVVNQTDAAHVDDLESLYLRQIIGVGAPATDDIQDLWEFYLDSQLAPPGDLQDRQSTWLTSIGHIASTITEQWDLYWISLLPPPPP